MEPCQYFGYVFQRVYITMFVSVKASRQRTDGLIGFESDLQPAKCDLLELFGCVQDSLPAIFISINISNVP